MISTCPTALLFRLCCCTLLVSVHEDTYTTVGKIESVAGMIRDLEQKNTAKTMEIMKREFDFDRSLKELKLT
jgi:BioD-like phosphotransacetylase family protein